MGEKAVRKFDRERLYELSSEIEPAKNEHIAREAVGIAYRWLDKAENQAIQIQNLENRAQRMRGKWIHLDECANEGYYCDQCYKKVIKDGWSQSVKDINFCPNCGADMREEQE